MTSTEPHSERPPIDRVNTWALSLGMLSFVIPVFLSVPAIVLGLIHRSRLKGDTPAVRMNRKLAGLAAVSGAFTMGLAAVYIGIYGVG